VLVPKSEIPGTGWFAVFQDPTGSSMAFYQSMPEARPATRPKKASKKASAARKRKK